LIKSDFGNLLKEIQPAKLVAVSKRKPIEDLQKIYNFGQRIFGENQVQELLSKIDALPNDILWHLIGPLQRNKVNKLVGKVDLIHSVDSLKLAEKINFRAEYLGIIQKILIQVNISGEETKSGYLINDNFFEEFKTLISLKNIEVLGLMTIGDHVDDAEKIAETFKKTKKLFDKLNSSFDINMTELSMGMTGDYPLAVKEGATLVRIGSKIFGKRDNK
jgi:pyridoxal phosphate enzyme (YggS family)